MIIIENEKGVVLAIEGGEGAGKGFFIRMLLKHRPDLIVVQEPGTTEKALKYREEIMNHPEYSEIKKTELFAKARASVYEEIVRPSLKEGKTIISDRSIVSSLVYQTVDGQLTVDEVIAENKKVDPDFRLPDGLILLQMKPEVALDRIKANGRETNYFDHLPIEYHNKINDQYTKVFRELDIPEKKLFFGVTDFESVMPGVLKMIERLENKKD